MQSRERKWWIGLTVAWLIAMAISAMLDSRVAALARDSGCEAFLRAHSSIREFIKLPGWYPFTIAVALLVAWRHRQRWREAIFVLAAGATSAVNELSKYAVGRARPFKTLAGESQTLTPFELHPFPSLHAKNLCFPSGHAALAFATAAALSILLPRYRYVFYVVALLIAVERVLENAHWMSDVVAAAALGIAGAWVVRRFWWDKQDSIVGGTETSGPLDRR